MVTTTITATVKFSATVRNLECAKANFEHVGMWRVLNTSVSVFDLTPLSTYAKAFTGKVVGFEGYEIKGRSGFVKLIVETEKPVRSKGWRLYLKLSDLPEINPKGLVGEFWLYHY